MPQPETPTARATEESRPVPEPTDLTALRTATLRLLTQGQAKAATTWRLVLTDTESLTGVGLVCTDPAHPGIDDIGCEYDEMGVYDCCPMVIETWHEKVATYLVALLNGDAATVENDGDEEITCARLHCPARVWFRHAEARGWHPLPTGSWYCPDEHVPGGRGGE
jgi:hypothetical protein